MGWREDWATAQELKDVGRFVEAAPFAQRVLDWMDENAITLDLYEPGVDDHEMPSMHIICSMIVTIASQRGWRAG